MEDHTKIYKKALVVLSLFFIFTCYDIHKVNAKEEILTSMTESMEIQNENDVFNKYIGKDIYEKYPFLKEDMVDKQTVYPSTDLIAGSKATLGKNGFQFGFAPYERELIEKKTYISKAWIDSLKVKLAALKQVAEEKGKKICYIIPPLKGTVYYDYLPDSLNIHMDGKDNLERLVEEVKDEVGFNIIYPLNLLLEAKKYLRVYALNDTHWNQLGGYIAANEIYDVIGNKVKLLSEQDISYGENYIYAVKYKGDGTLLEELYEGEYHYAPEIRCKSSSPRKETLTILGDSFRYWMANVFKQDYEKCYIVHRNCINDSFVVNDVLEADVLVIELVPNAYGLLTDITDRLIHILSTSE